MASKQQPMSGDGFTSQISGMSKGQLYGLMCQMKSLIEQNQQQARQILIENPPLTRALFQAQIMLGMVQPPQAMPNIQHALSQPQSAQMRQQPNGQATQPLMVQGGSQGQASSSQVSTPVRQHPAQPSVSVPSAPVSTFGFQSQTMASNATQFAQQTSGFLNSEGPVASPQYPIHMPMFPSQAQQSIQSPGMLHQPFQPPLPQQPRPPLMQSFPHQLYPQVSHTIGFQQSSAPQTIVPQVFHLGENPTSSFPQGQLLPSSQLIPNQHYQRVPHQGSDFGNHAGVPGAQFPVQWPFISGQPAGLGTAGQLACPPPLTPELEQALLQQVMSLTPEQVNLLPPDQRQQVMQLQEIMRR